MKFTHCSFLISIVFLLTARSTQAQTQILKKTIATVEAFKSISYTASSVANNPFSEELYETKGKVQFSHLNDTTKLMAYNISYQTKSSSGFTDKASNIFNQRDLLLLNNINKTYNLKRDYKDPNYVEYNVFKLVNTLKQYLNNKDLHFKLLADTVLNKQACYHIAIKTKDSVVQKTNSYDNLELLINKSNSLPIYWSSNQQGVVEKGGMKIGVVKLYSTTYADNYLVNATNSNAFDLKIPKDFKEEKRPLPMLSIGTPAPDWQLSDTKGNKLKMSGLKGKIVLLDITSTSCPACALSVGPLNDLHQKYKGTNVVIISINLDDTKQTIENFKNKNNVNYPVYLNGNLIKAKDHVSAIPTFYIVDKEGMIRNAYNGFFEDFEKIISGEIQKLM